MTIRERITLRLDWFRLSIAEAILRFLKVPDAVGQIMSDELSAAISFDVQAMLPLEKIAELEGRHSQLVDDIENLKELYREAGARIQRLELELHIESQSQDVQF